MGGLKRTAQKPVNFEKIHEIVQKREESPSEFLDRLTKALLKYTNLDPESQGGRQVLMTYFLSQSYPDIRAKLKKLEQGPATPQTEILATAFKVYHNREEDAERRRFLKHEKAERSRFQMLAQALRGPDVQASRTRVHKSTLEEEPPGPCYRCGKEGHWARVCPDPKPPTRPCPRCFKMGHWGIDCPSPRRGAGSATNPSLLALAAED